MANTTFDGPVRSRNGFQSIKAVKAIQMIPIAAPWRTADIVMLIIKIGNSKTKKLNGLGCLLAKKCIPIKKIIPNGI